MHAIADKTNQLNCLQSNLRKAARTVLSLYERELTDIAINGTQFTMLSSIRGMGKVTIGQLATFLAMDQTTVTRNINVLKRDGYVEAIAGTDKRTRNLQLTDHGEQVLDRAYPQWLKAQQALWDALGDEDAQKLLEMTNRLVKVTE